MRLEMAPEVRAALEAGRPVVALESTIIAHGFPRPANRAVASALEGAVREQGAVPATVALIGGAVRVGLRAAELDRIAGTDAAKCSLRDMAVLSAAGVDGATTVAATLRVAAAAGIPVFATGGIGGVHPGTGGPPDVSADLFELARSRTAVVSAGAKSILDLPATLEALESLGVPVIGFGCDEFPAFHTAESGLPLAHRADDVAGLADIVRAHGELDLPGAVLVCNPPPADLAMARDELDRLIASARRAAAAQGIAGPALTPFLLAELNCLSDGRTERLNRALAVANAALAADLAVELSG